MSFAAADADVKNIAGGFFLFVYVILYVIVRYCHYLFVYVILYVIVLSLYDVNSTCN